MCRLVVLVFCCYAAAAVSAHRGEGEANPNCFQALHISPYERPDSHRMIDTRRYDIQNVQWLALSRHHIIPYATMRDFYNALIRRDRSGFVRLFNDVINVVAQNVLGRRLVLDFEQQQPAVADIVDNHLSGDSVTDVMYTQEIYAWLPFNIYIGPHGDRRWDEAFENRFDTTAYAVIGRPLSNRLATVTRHMTAYIRDGEADDMNFVLREMASLVYEYRTPFAFNRNNWVVRNRINQYEFALATATLSSHEHYRELRNDEFCQTDTNQPTAATPRTDLRRKRDAPPMCLLATENHDTCCINTLDHLRQLHRSGNFAYTQSGDQLKVTNRSSGDTATNDVNLSLPTPRSYTAAGWFLRVLTLGAWQLL